MSSATATFAGRREESPRPTPVLEFKVGGEELKGNLVQNSTLQIIYDPARLPFIRLTRNGLPAWGIDATVRFHPGLETYAAGVVKNLEESGSGPRIPIDPVPAPMNVMVPPDALAVEMWFANTDIYGATSWDSRYGQNYWFQVAQAGPARPVSFRTGAQRDLSKVNVLESTVVKERRTLGAPPVEGSQLETHLLLKAWVKNIQFEKNVWIDFHVFDVSDNLMYSETVPLVYFESRSDGDVFALDLLAFKGSGGVPGSVWPRADARLIQFRLYYQVGPDVFTDGFLHESAIQADEQAQVLLAAAA
jgi:Family of unknown function (DUF6209)